MTHPNASNIVLLGFMASGKSRVGRTLASMLDYELVDIDAIIEREQGKSISEIFAHHGEAYFRKLETDALMKAREYRRSVIVPGGGAPTFFHNAQIIQQLGHAFFLDASLPLIMKRLTTTKKRPLGGIHSEEDRTRLSALYAFRRPLYLSLAHPIDVNHEDQAKTCNDIIAQAHALDRLAPFACTEVNDFASRYKIFHEPNVSSAIADIVIACGLKDYRPVIITTDHLHTVLADHVQALCASLSNDTSVITFPDGEQHKTIQSIHHIHEQMFAHKLTRKTVIVALGGGNVGDVAGFAASCFMRGVPFIQVPTTLLAMVDASIGGKTGIDVPSGKNLVGAFKNPHAVIIDPDFLRSLPADDLAAGMAEVIKHAIIADHELFHSLLNDTPTMTSIIERALKVKAQIVFADPKEQNIRAHLNLGHTFAHAIEKVSNYQIKHGFAVSMGLMLATKLSRKQNILEIDFVAELESLLHKYRLPTSLPKHLDKDALIAAMAFDKKRDNAGLKFVLPKKIGEVTIQYLDPRTIFSEED